MDSSQLFVKQFSTMDSDQEVPLIFFGRSAKQTTPDKITIFYLYFLSPRESIFRFLSF